MKNRDQTTHHYHTSKTLFQQEHLQENTTKFQKFLLPHAKKNPENLLPNIHDTDNSHWIKHIKITIIIINIFFGSGTFPKNFEPKNFLF